jgi:hypothetical protein
MMPRRRVVSLSLIGQVLASGTASVAHGAAGKAEVAQAATSDAERPGDEPGRYGPPPPAPSRFQLGLGSGLTLGLGDVWERRGDVTGSSGGPILLDLSLAPSYRVARELALGIRAGVGLDPGSRGTASSSGERVSFDRRLWHASATARYQPRPGRGAYLTLSAGVAQIVDSAGDISASQRAPLFAVAAGYDVHIARPFSLGFELRAAYAPFVGSSRLSADERYEYDVSAWLGAGVVLNVLP